MLGRMREVLARSGVELSDEELLDVLWLAGKVPPDAGPLARAAGAGQVHRPDPSLDQTPAAPPPAAPSAERPDPGPLPDSPPRRPVQATAQTERQPAPDSTPSRAHGVRAPDGRILDARELRLGKALRPLRQRFPDDRRHELDLARTVAAMADTGLPETVTRPVRTRWLSLVLVVDDGVSMVLWHRLAAEVRRLMERAGAFRDVRVHGLDTRSPGVPLLSTRPYRNGGHRLSTESVTDPTGNTLVLVVSDGVGAAWRDGRMRSAIDQWARCGPTAIVHALPPRLWPGSGISARPWRVTSHRRGGPPATWRVVDPVLPPDLITFDAVPVPVLEPSPEAFADWARLIASPGAGTLLPLWNGDGIHPGGRGDGTRQVDEAEMVLRFRAAASPEAYRLAVHLAAVAPVTPPVMRLVQGALGPPIDGGHVVEVFLGGLMRRVDTAGPTPLPQQQAFDFSPETRRILLGALAPKELLRTAQSVAERLEASVGRSRGFPALVGHPEGSVVIGDTGRPFAWLTERLLSRLGVPPAGAAPITAVRAASAGVRSRSTGVPIVLSPPRDRRTPALTGPPAVQAGPTEALPEGWSPLRPDDPRHLGPYRLHARNDHGWNAVRLYLGRAGGGEVVLVRTSGPLFDQDRAMAWDLMRTEAECLERMGGTHAPRLLDSNLGGEEGPPWLASSLTRRGEGPHAAPAPNLRDVFEENGGLVDPYLFRRVGSDLARAVARAHGLGLIHGSIASKTVLVTGQDVQLIGWMTSSRDGVHSPYRFEFTRSQVFHTDPDDLSDPTTESDVYALGAVLIAFATGWWTDLRADAGLRGALARSAADESIAEMLWRCLDQDPAGRPTADDLAEAFASDPADQVGPGHTADDLAAARETVRRLRESAARQPVSHEAELAGSLHSLANLAGAMGRPDEARAAAGEAAALYRRLADRPTHPYLPELARALNNLAVHLGEVNRSQEAMAAITEAVALYRQLHHVRPDAHAAGLALTLNNQSNRLGEMGREVDALVAVSEAVDLFRRLVREDHAQFAPSLAMSLNNLSNRLGEAGRGAEALSSVTEAVVLFREAAQRDPEPMSLNLAESLSNLAVQLGRAGRRDEALAALAESMEIRNTLTGRPRDAVEEDLQRSERVTSWLLDEDGTATAAPPASGRRGGR